MGTFIAPLNAKVKTLSKLSMINLQVKVLMRTHGLTEAQANALAVLIWGVAS